MVASKKRCIPFLSDGEMTEYTGFDLTDDEVELCYKNGRFQKENDPWQSRYIWKPNTPFESTLFYDGFARGCSSAKFIYRDVEGRRYWMFMTDMDSVIKRSIQPNELRGMFEYVKRGQNYGVKLL